MSNKGGMAGMMKQMQVMQQKMDKVNAELANKFIETESGGGMVKVKANGKQQIVSIKIDPQIIADNDAEMMEDLIVAAVNKAVEESGKPHRPDHLIVVGGELRGAHVLADLDVPEEPKPLARRGALERLRDALDLLMVGRDARPDQPERRRSRNLVPCQTWRR